MNEKTDGTDNEDTENSIRIKSEKIFELIRNSEIGFNQAFCGPFGYRKSKNKLYSFGKKFFCNFSFASILCGLHRKWSSN